MKHQISAVASGDLALVALINACLPLTEWGCEDMVWPLPKNCSGFVVSYYLGLSVVSRQNAVLLTWELCAVCCVLQLLCK